MAESTLVNTLTSYVPRLILNRVEEDPSPIENPLAERYNAAVLFTDISGFTQLTDQFSQRGLAGAEALADLLNDYFGQLIDLILDSGGDVVKFAGDALIALWPAEYEDMQTAILRAAQCGQAIQERLNDYQAEDVRLSLKVAISAGEVTSIHIGGVFGRWEFLLDGIPLVEVGMANDLAKAGQLLIGPAAWREIDSLARGESINFPGRGQGALLTKLLATVTPFQPQEHPELPESAAKTLSAYIPGAIMDRLSVGQSGWLAELRRVAVLFINLPDLNASSSLEEAQRVARLLQTSLYRYEGSINKLNVDDKGVTLVAALGLPPYSHEDDPARGVLAALMMRDELTKLGVQSAIGVTSGQIFCGSVGNDRRREYTMMGDIVNMSARLMTLAHAQAAMTEEYGVPILADEHTYMAARDQIQFEELPPARVKGKNEPVAVYHPLARRTDIVHAQTELIGREAERAQLAEALQNLQRGSSSQTIMLRGEAGIGKSRLLEELFRQAEPMNLTVLYGTSDAVDKNTPYHAWRNVFTQLLLESAPEPAAGETVYRDAALKHIQSMVETAAPSYARMTPLLNIVLPFEVQENELTSAMSAEVRGNNILELLTALLQHASLERPLLMVFDDLQWFDSASWALAVRVSKMVVHKLIVFSTRPIPAEEAPAEYRQLGLDPDVTIIDLESFNIDNIASLVRQRLGVKEAPQKLLDLIWEKAAGHPFYSEELVFALRDGGMLDFHNGVVSLRGDNGASGDLVLPDTLQGIITSRIDRLPPSEKLALKVASVIGREFMLRALRAIYPIDTDRPNLERYLNTLKDLNFTTLMNIEPDLAYLFKHAITHEVAYSLMLFSQRQQLHESVAEWMETAYQEDLSPYYALLAYHWQRAAGLTEVNATLAPKALEYLEKAGEQSLKNYANEEAIEFINRCLKIAESLNVSKERQAQWHKSLGQAYLGQANLVDSIVEYRVALDLLGKPMADNIVMQVVQIIINFLRVLLQDWLRRRGLMRTIKDEAKRERILEIARIYSQMGIPMFLQNDTVGILNTATRYLSLAQRAGGSPELAYAYAQMSVVLALIPWHSRSEAYSAEAERIHTKFNQPDLLVSSAIAIAAARSGAADWKRVDDLLEQALAVCEEMGDERQAAETLSFLAFNAYLQGLPERGDIFSDKLEEVSKRSNNLLHQAWSREWRTFNAFRRGDAAGTNRQVEALRKLENSEGFPVAPVLQNSHAILEGFGYLINGDQESALAKAEWVNERLKGDSPVDYSAMLAYHGAPEILLHICERGIPSRSEQLLVHQVGISIKNLENFQKVFPFAQPFYWRYVGWRAIMRGEEKKAMDAWEKSIARARALHMPHEVAVAHYEIGRHLPKEDPRRNEYLDHAIGILASLGYNFYLDKARAARG